MPDESWYTRVESKIDQLLGSPTDPGPVDPGVLLAPTGFRARYDPASRTVLCSWDPQTDLVQLHELATDPTNTLKATLGPGVMSRVSSPLRGGHPYVWAARSVRDNQVSTFTEQITAGPGVELPPGEPEPQPGEPPQPSDVLDLRNWTIMLPTGSQGDPDNEYVIGRSIPNTLFVDPADGAVVFRTDVVNGVHSPNSKYPRTEAREMADGDWTKASWNSTEGHWLEADLAADTSHLSTRARTNAIQIHDGSDDVMQVMRHERDGLGVMHSDGKAWESIDPTYRDSQRFKCKVHAVGNRIKVYYNGALAVDIPKTGSGWYFKIGCYAQTGGSSTFVEPAGSYAQVKVWSFTTGR